MELDLCLENYHQRKITVEDQLKNINNEINKVTGNITLSKYRIMQNITDYQKTIAQKKELDKLLNFKISTSFNHPRLDIYGYTDELNHIRKIYNNFRDKHINDIPIDKGADLNIYFPENNRWKIDHLEKIRKETSKNIQNSHYNFQEQETILYKDYQQKRNKLEWTIQQLDNDKKMNRNKKKQKINLIRNELNQLEKNMISHFSTLGNSFPEIIQKNDTILDEFKNIPIKLENNQDNEPHHRLIKRRLIMLNMKKNNYENKISKLAKNKQEETNKIKELIKRDDLYHDATELSDFTHLIDNTRNTINDLQKTTKENSDYLKELITSRDILMEELHLLESMDIFTQPKIDDSILIDDNELISQYESDVTRPKHILNNQFKFNNNTDTNTNILDELTNTIDNIDLYEMIQSINQDINIPLLDLDSNNQIIPEETIKTKQETLKFDINNPNVFMEMEKDINTNDLAKSTKLELETLSSKLNKLENFTLPTVNNNITQHNQNNTTDTLTHNGQIIVDINEGPNINTYNDIDILKEFEDSLNNTYNDSDSDEIMESLNKLNINESNVINSNLDGLLKICD